MAYAQAQAAVGSLYRDSDAWTRKAINNVGCSGKFSSDCSIGEYAADIWKVSSIAVK
jgi:starch phosphorylase